MRPDPVLRGGHAAGGLEPLFNPESIAIVGASPNAGSITGQPLRHLLDRGYAGRIYPVTARYPEIAGLRCYGSVSEITGDVDLAVIVIKAELVPGVLAECARKGVKAVVVISGGFAEAGEAGSALQAELKRICRETGIRMVGPNCQGMLNVPDDVCAGFGPVLSPDYGVPPGALSFVTQSGGFGFAVVSLMAQQGLGFRRVVSTGNEADIDAVEFIGHFVDDPGTRVVMAYLEGLSQGARLREVVRRAMAADKPILVWKVGTTEVGKRAANSHTAGLSGDHAVSRALLREMGIIEIGDVHEFVDCGRAFLGGKRPAGRRVAILSASGGAGVLVSDRCIEAGLEVPVLSAACRDRLAAAAPALGSLQNPVDVMGGVYNDPERLRQVLGIIADDPDVDAVIVINPLRRGKAAVDIANVIIDIDSRTTKPLFVTWSARPDFAGEAFAALSAANVPWFETPARCARGLGTLARYAAARRRGPAPARTRAPGLSREEARALLRSSPDTVLGEHAAKRVLELYGLPVTRERLAKSVAQALAAAEELGYPVVLKVQSPDIAHKTEAGAIRLGIGNGDELTRAYDEIMQNAARHAPQARIEGVLVQEMVTGAIETIVGVTNDPSFGPVVMFGLGGIYAEIMRDVSFRMPPLDVAQAREMISETRCYLLLAGARTGIEADIDALAEAIVTVGDMAIDLKDELADFEMNPLAVLPKGRGVRALDALMFLTAGATARQRRTGQSNAE